MSNIKPPPGVHFLLPAPKEEEGPRIEDITDDLDEATIDEGRSTGEGALRLEGNDDADDEDDDDDDDDGPRIEMNPDDDDDDDDDGPRIEDNPDDDDDDDDDGPAMEDNQETPAAAPKVAGSRSAAWPTPHLPEAVT